MEHKTETKRLKNLYKYQILDTPEDGCYDELTSLAAKIFKVPIVIISLVDKDRIWFKSSVGVTAEEMPRNGGLCTYAIMSDDIYIVEDARNDPRTMTNPLVVGLMGLQFYAAAPLKSKSGHNLGTFCIIDKEPRTLKIREGVMLRQFSRIIMEIFEVKLKSRLEVQEFIDTISQTEK